MVQEGETWVDGSPIADLTGFTSAVSSEARAIFDMTSDGEQLAFRATLADGRVVAFRVRPNGGVEDIPGCAGNGGLLHMPIAPKLGASFSGHMLQAPAEGVHGFLFLSTGPATVGSPCGTVVPGIGEVLIDLAPPNPLSTTAGFWPALGGQTIFLLGPVPSDPSFFGATLFAQGLWLDVTGVSPAEPIRLTNGLALSIGQ